MIDVALATSISKLTTLEERFVESLVNLSMAEFRQSSHCKAMLSDQDRIVEVDDETDDETAVSISKPKLIAA